MTWPDGTIADGQITRATVAGGAAVALFLWNHPLGWLWYDPSGSSTRWGDTTDHVVPGRTAQAADIAVRLEAAFNARDFVALASLYSDTAVLMPPNEPMLRGRAEIERWFERALSRLRNIRVLATESIVEGDRAFQVGTFTSSAIADAASSSAEEDGATQAGKYVLFLKKQAGEWKIEYDIWNLDQPAG